MIWCKKTTDRYDDALKILLFFYSGVGKSSLIKQYICEVNPTEIAPTIGASFSTFKIKLEEGKVKMQVKNKLSSKIKNKPLPSFSSINETLFFSMIHILDLGYW